MAEYNVMRKVLHVMRGKQPTDATVKNWYNRLRGIGSQLSTTRQALRLGIWLNSVKFFVAQFKCFLERRRCKDKEKKPAYASKLEWVGVIMDTISGIADNWYFFCRVGTL